jgi:hypothetical protein
METKTTKITYNTPSGKVVNVEVLRKYGVENAVNHDSENGIDYPIKQFVSEAVIGVEVVGMCKFKTRCLPKNKHPKFGVYYLSDGRNTVAVPDDIAQQIWQASEERLTKDLPPYILQSIAEAKDAIKHGRVLPSDKLSSLRKKYNSANNEGGEGYNPYDYYLTEEHILSLKERFPECF